MKRSTKQKLHGFLLLMKHEYRRLRKSGRHVRARQLKSYLQTHYQMMGKNGEL